MIETGRRLSLQHHERKDESIYVLAGRLRLHLEDEAGAMQIGTSGRARTPTCPPAAGTASRRSSGSS